MNRRDPLPYLRLASIRTRAGFHEEAIDILRRAWVWRGSAPRERL